ncbi:GAF domain-containing protein [soil metagenome]
MGEVESRPVLRVAEAFAAQPAGPPELRMCAAASKLLDAAGVGVSLSANHDLLDSGLQTVCATDGGRPGEALQYDLGEGPSYTAHRTGWPVQVPDLERDDTWPAFAEAAAGLGVRAVSAFPVRSGSVGLGALTLYQHVAGELTSEQYSDALVFARFAFNLFTSLQAGRPPGELDQVFTDSLSNSVEVHQASGVVAVQLGIPVGAALAVLRAHAFAEGCSLAEVATQVVEHRLQLDPLHH